MLSIHLFVRRADRTTTSKPVSAKFRCDEQEPGERPSDESNGKARTRSEWYDVCEFYWNCSASSIVFFVQSLCSSVETRRLSLSVCTVLSVVRSFLFCWFVIPQMHLYTHARTHHKSSVHLSANCQWLRCGGIAAVYRPAKNLAPRQQTDQSGTKKLCVLCLLYT